MGLLIGQFISCWTHRITDSLWDWSGRIGSFFRLPWFHRREWERHRYQYVYHKYPPLSPLSYSTVQYVANTLKIPITFPSVLPVANKLCGQKCVCVCFVICCYRQNEWDGLRLICASLLGIAFTERWLSSVAAHFFKLISQSTFKLRVSYYHPIKGVLY